MRFLVNKFKLILIFLPLLLIVSCTGKENSIPENTHAQNGSNGALDVEEQENKLDWLAKDSVLKEKGEQLKDLTWEEFEALSPDEQMKFQNSFSSFEEFDRWMQKSQEKIDDFSWESEKGQPSSYTWEEFEALSPDEQMKFQNSFSSFNEFDKWMQRAKEISDNFSQESENGQSLNYTWEEFEELSPDEQMKFQNSFSSFEEFDKWMQREQEKNDDFSWESEKGQPSSYTWEEFEALSPDEQMKFQNSFESIEKFNEWLQKAQGDA